MIRAIIKTASGVFLFLLGLGLLVWGSVVLKAKPVLYQPQDFSAAVFSSTNEMMHLRLAHDQQYRYYVRLSEISPTLIKATMLYEDRYYLQHPGINLGAMVKAFWTTYIKRKKIVGASTLSMQVARLIGHLHTRSLLGKIQQIGYAFWLEYHYSKMELLEAYLNLAPYGYNIQGVGAASWLYFHKPPNELSFAESLALAVIPQSPKKRALNQNNNAEVLQARALLYQRWLAEFPDANNDKKAIALPLKVYALSDKPFIAPHVDMYLYQRYPQQLRLYSTVNINLQKTVENQAKRYLENVKSIGVDNLAVLLVDIRDMSVLASVGSANFFKESIQGQIDGTRAKRSPGSTLKPFIYGLALQQGVIIPQTKLMDTPMHFAEYDPKNIDDDYMGPLTAESALNRSRNVPAVFLASELTDPDFYDFLKKLPIANLYDKSFYGLGLALGGVEVSMQELTQLYASILNHGKYGKLKYLNSENVRLHSIMTREAAFILFDMLSRNKNLSERPVMKIAWKTGTSSRFRDAWSIAIFDHYVLAVWLGRFDGRSNPALTGMGVAMPLLLQMLHALSAKLNLSDSTLLQDLNVKKIKVCKASGRLPNAFCPELVDSWFIPGVSAIKKDTIHREVLINKRTGLRTCVADKDSEFTVYEFWPTDVLELFDKAGISRATAPPFEQGCKPDLRVGSGVEPIIQSPNAAVKYVINLQDSHPLKIPFYAIVDGDVKQVYWFLNNSYLGRSRPREPLYWHAIPGKYSVRVVDDKGQVVKSSLQVIQK